MPKELNQTDTTETSGIHQYGQETGMYIDTHGQTAVLFCTQSTSQVSVQVHLDPVLQVVFI